jgi:hypothetical protein
VYDLIHSVVDAVDIADAGLRQPLPEASNAVTADTGAAALACVRLGSAEPAAPTGLEIALMSASRGIGLGDRGSPVSDTDPVKPRNPTLGDRFPRGGVARPGSDARSDHRAAT